MTPDLVYSTDHGRMCPRCSRPATQCACQQVRQGTVKGDGRVRVSYETKGRKGKGVSLVSGLPLDTPGLKSLAKELKRKCGSGGTVQDGVLEIQGDHRDRLVQELISRGYAAKRSGG